MVRLTVLQGHEAPLILETENGSVSLGKSPASELVLADPYVSRYHGQILWNGKHYVYIDLQSSNGSAIRRREQLFPVGPEENFQVHLEDGDCILVGDHANPTVISVECLGSPEARTEGSPPGDLAADVLGRTAVCAWRTIERSLSSDARAVSALYRLTRVLSEAKEEEGPGSLLGMLAEALFETFPNVTHALVAEADLEDGETGELPVTLRMARSRDGTGGSEAEVAFSRSLIRRALQEQTGLLFSASSGDLGHHQESVAKAHIFSGILVPLCSDQNKRCVLQVDNRAGGEEFTRRDLEILTVYSVHAAQIENLYSRLRELAEQKKAIEAENIRLRFQIRSESGKPEEIVGASLAIQTIFHTIEKVADLPTTVLLQGETGTGKELVARALHYNSRFRQGAFVAQNCAALSETLLDSELFGHRKGAFTGAQEDKRGLFLSLRTAARFFWTS